MRGQATLTKDEAERLVQAAVSGLTKEIDRLRTENAEYRAQLSGKDDLIDKLYAEIDTLRKAIENAPGPLDKTS